MTTYFNTETIRDSLEEIRDSDSEGSNKENATGRISEFSKTMTTHFETFETKFLMDNKAKEKYE